MNLNGVVQVGYNDVWGSDIASSHSVNVGGNGTLSGFYYDPNFLNFNFAPYYNQSSQNSDSRSLFDSSGFEFNSGIFGGSHFPGSVTFPSPGTVRAISEFPACRTTPPAAMARVSVLAGERSARLAELECEFQHRQQRYSVLGADQNGSNDYKNFNLRSNYSIAGFNLNAGYNIGNSNSEIPLIFGNDTLGKRQFQYNSWFVSGSHILPMHGSASASFSHSYVDSDYLGYSFNGTIDTLNAFAGINPTQKLSLSVGSGLHRQSGGRALPVDHSWERLGIAEHNRAQAQTSGTASAAERWGFPANRAIVECLLHLRLWGLRPGAQLATEFCRPSAGSKPFWERATAPTATERAVYTRALLGGSMNAAVNFADNTSDYQSGNALSFATNLGYSRAFATGRLVGMSAMPRTCRPFC